jgi:hypothetical protein
MARGRPPSASSPRRARQNEIIARAAQLMLLQGVKREAVFVLIAEALAKRRGWPAVGDKQVEKIHQQWIDACRVDWERGMHPRARGFLWAWRPGEFTRNSRRAELPSDLSEAQLVEVLLDERRPPTLLGHADLEQTAAASERYEATRVHFRKKTP